MFYGRLYRNNKNVKKKKVSLKWFSIGLIISNRKKQSDNKDVIKCNKHKSPNKQTMNTFFLKL